MQIKAAVQSFLTRYVKLVPALSEYHDLVRSADEDTAALMTRILTTIGDAGHQMYMLIDEYDHFGNRLLSDGKDDVYKELVRATGFVRSFYAALKAFTATSTIARTFITGVSPIMLDDLSSGFNIIKLSQCGAFYLMTEKEAAQGYCDLLLGVRSPGSAAKYAWIIEAKYVESKATKATIARVVEQGYQQIDKYALDKDFVAMLALGREVKAGVLVFVGLKDVLFKPWPRPTKAAVEALPVAKTNIPTTKGRKRATK